MVIKILERRRCRRWVADLKAEMFARWVRAASDRRLESVMGSRFRGVLLWQIFRTMRQGAQLDPRVNAVVEFGITGRRGGGIDRYQLIVTDGRCRTSRAGGLKPALTLELEPVAFLCLVGGRTSPQRLLILRKLRLRGDLRLALALPTALRLPRRRL
jgi:SCP-2 sterol transfer family